MSQSSLHKARVGFLFSGLFSITPVHLPPLHPGPTRTPINSPYFCAQPCRDPQENSGPSSGPPSGWIIPASMALATGCQTGAMVSCFGMAPTWHCAPQGGK